MFTVEYQNLNNRLLAENVMKLRILTYLCFIMSSLSCMSYILGIDVYQKFVATARFQYLKKAIRMGC